MLREKVIHKVPYSVLLIGLGKVGFQYDEAESVDAPVCLTHASAFFQDQRFKILAAIDPSHDVGVRFTGKYSLPTYASLAEEIKDAIKNIDVVVIATPTATHASVFEKISSLNPKVIIFEKPVTESLKALENIQSIREKALPNAHYLVNYFRSLSSAMGVLKQAIEQGFYGDLIQGQINYCRGFLNNGSHFFDLFLSLFDKARVSHVQMNQYHGGFGQSDLNIDAYIHLSSGLSVICTCFPEDAFFSGRLTLYMTQGILVIDERGHVLFSRAEQSPFGDDVPGLPQLIDEINFSQPFNGLLNYVAARLEKSEGSPINHLDRFSEILEVFFLLKNCVLKESREIEHVGH